MRLPNWLTEYLFKKLTEKVSYIEPDFIIGENYMDRWWLAKNLYDHDTRQGFIRSHTRKTAWYNVYLHKVSGSDDERALHDHPWFNISIVLRGTYREVFSDCEKIRPAGSIVFRTGKTAHRLELVEGPIWTIFITGPKYREWGFRCANGWRHWRVFTETRNGRSIGKGCGE